MKNEYDLLKVFAILLVVVGHITILYQDGGLGENEISGLSFFTDFIYLFHMPLFISISGAIYAIGMQTGKYCKFSPLIINKAKRLLIPFIFVGITCLAPVLIITGLSENYVMTVVSILTGGTYIKHLWYLPALFWIFIYAWLICKFRLNLYIMYIASVSLAVLCSSLAINLNIFCIGNSIQYLPYFIMGIIFYQQRELLQIKLFPASLIILCSFAFIQYASDILWIDNICRILLPCAILICIYILVKPIYPIFNKLPGINYLLKQSYSIYLFHVPIIYLLYIYISHLIPYYAMIPLTFFVAIIGSAAIATIFRKIHFQIFIGERFSN